MDQIKIGKFIAKSRKSRNFTQKQLAETLSISDKTISKWECGKGLPEVSLMLPLCASLDITVNDLLSGEKVSLTDYQRKAEGNMMNLMKENEENRKIFILSIMVGV
ncbi:MAG: helix-turn-helix transcriptional regulator, partial [Anaerostipes sp.]|nr:helix-turn-helix transcriptional regulator [Anaerostipes sp.]